MSGRKLQVLLVDDHAVVRGGLRLLLAQTDDMEVASEAEDAEQAIHMIRQSEFDVALVDIGLPGKGGLDLLKQIKTERPKLAVLMLSMYAEEVYAVRALKAGASGYLTKNSPPATLLAAIRKVAGGGRHVSPALLEQSGG
jgi:DNA-binding NarL/FixJ family response regulator